MALFFLTCIKSDGEESHLVADWEWSEIHAKVNELMVRGHYSRIRIEDDEMRRENNDALNLLLDDITRRKSSC